MTLTTRSRLQDAALCLMVVFCLIAALWFAENGFSRTAFIGTALICLLVLAAGALAKRSPDVWAARVASTPTVIAVYVLAGIVVVFYVLGMIFPATT
jgi:hypothetical protein